MFRKTLLGPVAASAVVATSFLGAPSASTATAGQAVWGPATRISASSRVHLNSPDVAVDAAGNATAVWSAGDSRSVVKAARRPAGGPWRTPVTIGRGWYPQVGADARGNVTVVWDYGPRYRVMSARRPAGGHWSNPVALSEPGGGFEEWTAQWPELAVSRGGAAVVTWWYAIEPDEEVFPGRVEAVYRPPGGRWSARHVLARRLYHPARVAIDARGNVTAAYLDAERRVRAVRRVVGRGWLSPVRISADRPESRYTFGVDVQVAVDARGDATAIWGDSTHGVKAASRPRFHRWSAPVSLRPASRSSQEWWLGERLAMDDAGTALFLYPGKDGTINARSKPLSAPWGAPHTILPGTSVGQYGGLTIVFNRDGDALLSWGEGDYPDGTRQASYRPRGGSWGLPQQFANDSAATALYRNGNAVAVWSGPACQNDEPCRVWTRAMTAPN